MMSIMIRALLVCVATVTFASAGLGRAAAQDPRWEIRSENSISRSDPFFESNELDSQGNLGLETGVDSNNWLRFVKPISGRRVWRFEQQARLRAYDERDELNSVLLTPRIQYWAPLGSGWQVRAIADSSVLFRDGDRHYTRAQAEAQLRSRSEDGSELVFRGRFGHYDFGKQVVAGLDQDQWRFGIQRNSNNAAQSGTRLSGFVITSDALLDKFSFDEWRAEAVFWTRTSERTEVSLRLLATQRDYDGNFSAIQPFARSDTRWAASARAEYHVSDRRRLFAELGYLDNDSNISQREFSGVTFRLGVRIDLR